MGSMVSRILRQLTLGAAIAATAATVLAEDAQTLFQALLEESGMVMKCDEGYVDAPLVANEVLPFEKALRTADGVMEIRFAIRPLARITIDYEDPHNAAPEPEHLFPLLFQSLTESLSGGRHSPHREYPAKLAMELFNAEWAGASTFDVVDDFQTEYKHGFMVAMHGSGKADAYTVMLFNDYEAARPLIDQSLTCLVFRPAAESAPKPPAGD